MLIAPGGAGGGASQALDNLADVAINESLIPATANSVDVGSEDKPFASAHAVLLFVGGHRLEDSGNGYLQVNGAMLIGGRLAIGSRFDGHDIYFADGFGSLNGGSGDVVFATTAGNSNLRLMPNGTGGVGVNASSVDPSAVMQIDDTARGFLPPRMTTTQRAAIGGPAEGLVIYNTTTHKLQVFNGSAWVDL